MGLDIYINGRKRVNGLVVEGEDVLRVEIEICYWRKDHKLRDLISELLGEDVVEMNCKDYWLEEETITELIDLIQGKAIKEYTEDITNTVTQLDKALELKRKGWDIIYHAWW